MISSFNAAKGRLFTLIINITRNKCVDTLRSKAYNMGKRTVAIKDVFCKEALNPFRAVDVMDVGKLIHKLSPDFRRLIELSFYYGFRNKI